MSAVVAAVVHEKLATLHELETIYGTEGLWDLFEINAVSQHNEYLAVKASRQ